MIPHLLQLKNGNFTQCKLVMLLSFKSQYTLRLGTSKNPLNPVQM